MNLRASTHHARPSRHWAPTLAIALALATPADGPVRAEVCNYYAPLPSYDVNVYTITLAGNVIADLNLTATETDAGLNPFVYVGGTSTVTAALDANGNTVVTFTGSIPISSSDSFSYGPPGSVTNFEPHIGVDGSLGAANPGGGALLPVISHSFSNSGTGQTFALPGLPMVAVTPLVGGSSDVHWLVFFTQVTNAGVTIGQWAEEPFDGTKTPSVTLTDYSASSETLSGSGYFISESYIPLDQLNFALTPPPGDLGSPFIPLPGLDGQTLTGGNGIGGAGGSIGPLSVPEPSGLISMALGLLIAGGYLRRRRIALRHRQNGMPK